MKTLRIGQAHLQFAQANAATKNCKRACPADPIEQKQRNANKVYKSLGNW
ncbi:MAG: hypothetical protein PHC38_13235 [Weeksellaceae bacterium]|jgi:hypothetical protein|nr:hypothetical protein [Weeksellaceae bacterium]